MFRHHTVSPQEYEFSGCLPFMPTQESTCVSRLFLFWHFCRKVTLTTEDHSAATIQSACWVMGLSVFSQNSLSPFSSHCRYLLQLHPLNMQHRPKSSSFCCCAPKRKREKSFSHCRKSIPGWAEVCKAGWRRGGAPQNYKLQNTSSVSNVLNMTKWWRIRKSEGGFMKPEMCLRITQTARGLAEMVCVTLPVVHFS